MISAAILALATARLAESKEDPLLYCEARTPSGATLGLKILAVSENGQLPILFVEKIQGTVWPEVKGTLLAFPVRRGENEIEFVAGPKFIRLGTNVGVKNLTILSSRNGNAAQALSFGFCGKVKIDPPPAIPARSSDVFSSDDWRDGCFFTSPAAGVTRGSFMLDHAVSDNKFTALFTPKDGALWPGPLRVARQLLKPSPKSEARGIELGVGRFAPEPGNSGPTGMDMIFVDVNTKQATVVVRFSKFNESGQPGFAICGLKSFKEQIK